MDRDTNKIRGILFALFYSILSITFLWIILLNIKTNITHYQSAFWLSLIMIAIAIVFIKKTNFSKVIIDGTRKNEFLLISILFLISTIITIYIGLETRVEFLWDFGIVQQNAFNIAKTGNYVDISYFARYPNNNFILLIATGIYKFLFLIAPNLDIYAMYKILIVINSLLINMSILFIYLSSKKIWNSKVALFSTIITYTATPILLYSEIFYTDTVGIFFVSLTMFLYVKLKETKTSLSSLFFLILIGISIGLGYRIKAFVLIIAVGIIIDLVLGKIKFQEKIKKVTILIVTLLTSLVITSALFTSIIPVTDKLKTENEFPIAHWVMMGLNTQNDGRFAHDDYKYSLSINGYENKKEKEIEKIKDRISEFGPLGLVRFLFVNKVTRTWADGGLMTDYYGSREGLVNGFIQQIYHRDTKYNYKFHVYFQVGIFILWFFVFLGALLFKKRNEKIDFINISIFGLFLFQLIWECNARYIYCFIPLFIISATNGFVTFKNLVRGGKRVKRHSKT